MKHRRAFSLVEVTLALGVIAFGLLAVVGLIPIALKASRDAVDLTRTSMIAQDVAARLPTLPYTDSQTPYLPPYTSATASKTATWFYDAAGHWLTINQSATPPYTNAYYRVDVVRNVPASYPVNTDSASRPLSDYYSTRLLAATATVTWPLDLTTGISIGGSSQKAVYPLLTRAMP